MPRWRGITKRNMAMRTVDIQIGDWVRLRYKSYPENKEVVADFRVSQIVVHGPKMYAWSKESGNMGPVVDLEPIPVTPEFLEKNGFSLSESTDVGDEYVYAADRDKCPQTIVAFSIYNEPVAGARSLVRCWTKPDGVDGQNDAHICNVRYVHELQHILKICGIDKDIVL